MMQIMIGIITVAPMSLMNLNTPKQGKASEVAAQSVNYDLVISTTVLGGECHCPLVIGTQFLLGRGTGTSLNHVFCAF